MDHTYDSILPTLDRTRADYRFPMGVISGISLATRFNLSMEEAKETRSFAHAAIEVNLGTLTTRSLLQGRHSS